MSHEKVKKTIAGVQRAQNDTVDIIVYGKTPELHDQPLRHTLQKLMLNGLTLSRAKCVWDQSHIDFLGHVLSAEGISPDPAMVQVLRESETTVQCKESTVVFRNDYSARFIQKFSTLAAPLRELG